MSNDENKETDANKKMTAAEFLNGALAGKFDVGALMPFLLEAKGKTTEFDGKEWPCMFSLDDEIRNKINEQVTQIFDLCRANAVPCVFVMQELNVDGIGLYNVMNIIPKERSGRKMLELGNMVQAFIGDGSIESNMQSLDYDTSRVIANITALLYRAKQHQISIQDFATQLKQQMDIFERCVEKIGGVLESSTPVNPEPSENDEKDF